MTHTQGGAPAVDAAALPMRFVVSDVYRIYVLMLIWMVMVLRVVDLQIISVVLEPIRREFSITDTQLGLLSGLAFSLFYGGLGLVVGWLADRSIRRNIIAVALAVWSAMTAMCGLTTSFTGLLLARAGVGMGEAGGQAPAFSLISDYFGARRRASAFAVLNSAVPVGVFLGLLIGGWASATYGWRAAFMVVGIPGVLIATAVRFTVREAPRGCSDERRIAPASESVGETVRYLWGNASYRHLALGSCLFTMGAMGSGIWIPSFFTRVHGMPPAQVATWLAFIYGGGGVAGVLLGGRMTERMVERTGDRRWFAWLPAYLTAAILPLAVFVYLWPNPVQALFVHIGVTVLMHAWMGPVYASIQSVAGATRRAMAAALNMLLINLIAYGMGPLLVGAGSDYLSGIYGTRSLGYAILGVVVLAYGWASIHFYLAARTLREGFEAGER